MNILSFNVCRSYKLSDEHYSERLSRIAKWLNSITAPDIIALQEFIVGAECKYITHFLSCLTNAYKPILPEGFEDNFKAGINIVFIKENLFVSDEKLKLKAADTTDFDNLYNYLLLRTRDGKEYRILNLHMPQLSNSDRPLSYQKIRAELSCSMWKAVIAEIHEHLNDPYFIVLGDMNADINADTANKDNLEYLAFQLVDTAHDRQKITYVCNNDNGVFQKNFDYIFVSRPTIIEAQVFASMVDNTPLKKGLSDHAAVTIQISEK